MCLFTMMKRWQRLSRTRMMERHLVIAAPLIAARQLSLMPDPKLL
ncbi:MAG: hypothetical protein QM488_16020 [Rhizobiaceae bacterium]